MIYPVFNPAPSISSPQRKIIELRELLAHRFPSHSATPERPQMATGIAALDNCLRGGLPKAALTEIVCSRHSLGSTTIIQSLIESTHAAGNRLALVDACNSFDPDGLSNERLSALLWVRCHGSEHAIKAADLLLRDGNLPLVILDLMLCSERQVRAIPSTYWYRLQRVVEGNGSTALIFTSTPVVASAAATVRLTRCLRLRAMDFLRRQLTTQLQLETVRTRRGSLLDTIPRPAGLAVG